MDVFRYKKGKEIEFKDIKDKQCFYSNGVLYKRIFSQDLKEYEITSVNAISVVNGGLTKFSEDETVIRAITIHCHTQTF